MFGDLSQALRDVVAIPVTPYADGVPDCELYGALLRRLVEAGVRVLTPNGNTGEFYALNADERRQLLTAAAAAVDGAEGFTSGLVNVNPAFSLRLRDALREARYEQAKQMLEQIGRFEDLRAADRSANNVSVVKEAMHQLGLCDRSVRPPSTVLPEAERHEVAKIVAAWGQIDDLKPL